MLLQSHVYENNGYTIQLLPSLPESWADGSFRGLKARGGFEVAAEWKSGRLEKIEIKSLLGNPLRVWYRGKYMKVDGLKKGEVWSWNRGKSAPFGS